MFSRSVWNLFLNLKVLQRVVAWRTDMLESFGSSTWLGTMDIVQQVSGGKWPVRSGLLNTLGWWRGLASWGRSDSSSQDKSHRLQMPLGRRISFSWHSWRSSAIWSRRQGASVMQRWKVFRSISVGIQTVALGHFRHLRVLGANADCMQSMLSQNWLQMTTKCHRSLILAP